MSSETIPEWAQKASMSVTGIMSAGHPTNQRCARALIAAERRGLEKAAEVAEGLYLQETENHGDLYDGDVAAAIRSLGEKI